MTLLFGELGDDGEWGGEDQNVSTTEQKRELEKQRVANC